MVDITVTVSSKIIVFFFFKLIRKGDFSVILRVVSEIRFSLIINVSQRFSGTV